MPELHEAVSHATRNRGALQSAVKAACYHCETVFETSDVVEWIPPDTAVCPHCSVDAVLPDTSGFEFDRKTLRALRDYWFEALDAKRYRLRCEARTTLGRTIVERTHVVMAGVDPDLTALLDRVLLSSPIPKPMGHQGGMETDYFDVDVPHEALGHLVDHLGLLEASAAAGEIDEDAREIASLLDAWNACRIARAEARD